MKELSKVTIIGSEGRMMAVDLRCSGSERDKPVIVFVHGFKGFKDWGPFPLACDALAEAGFVVVAFNFSHNGTTQETPMDFADLEAFGLNNYTKELHDLGKIIDWIASDAFPLGQADITRIFLIGHSRGGGDVIVKANEDNRVKAIVTWAAVEAFGQWFDEEELRTWERDGVIYSYNGRTGQNMPMYFQMREDFLANQARLDIPASAKTIAIPWLIIHGDVDPTVPVMVAEHLHQLQPHSKLLIVKGGDHTFGGRHPWEENKMSGLLKQVVEETAGFFGQIR